MIEVKKQLKINKFKWFVRIILISAIILGGVYIGANAVGLVEPSGPASENAARKVSEKYVILAWPRS